jgi:uncharacterized membrane protein (DUF106 family)
MWEIIGGIVSFFVIAIFYSIFFDKISEKFSCIFRKRLLKEKQKKLSNLKSEIEKIRKEKEMEGQGRKDKEWV